MGTLSKTENLFTATVYQPGTIPDPVLDECVQFRTAVYVAEGYLPEDGDSPDPDHFDTQSTHFCVRACKTGHLVGYCRMIHNTPLPLPMTKEYETLEHAPEYHVEISRFSILNAWRGNLSVSGMAPLFHLAKEMLIVSQQENIRHWGCLIDERFQKLCQRFFKMDFHILGNPQIYLGSACVPCIIDLNESIRNNLYEFEAEGFWNGELQTWILELEQDERNLDRPCR